MTLLASFLLASTLVSPESQGVSSAQISTWLKANEQQLNALHGFVLRRHNHVIAEGSWAPYETLTTPHRLYSHSKSFTSTAIGFLVDDGKLDLDARVEELLPDKAPANPSENQRQLRVRDLLTMNVGLGEADAERHDPDGDWEKAFLAAPRPKEPGTAFQYDSGATYLLACIVERISGEKMMDFLKRRLFDPIGITSASTTCSPSGTPCGGWGMNMTTPDIALFGQFLLNEGVWNNQSLLSREWVVLATSRQTWSGAIAVTGEDGSDWHQGYCFQFWRCCGHNIYRADGANGQFTIVMPDYDAVLSINAGLDGEEQKCLKLVWDLLLPAFKAETLAEDPTALAALREQCDHLALPTVNGVRKGNEALLNRDYSVNFGWTGAVTINLTETATGWLLKLQTPTGTYNLPVGYNSWERGTFRFTDKPYEVLGYILGDQPLAASGAFQPDGSLHVRLWSLFGPHRLELTFSQKEGNQPVCTGWLLGIGGFEIKPR